MTYSKRTGIIKRAFKKDHLQFCHKKLDFILTQDDKKLLLAKKRKGGVWKKNFIEEIKKRSQLNEIELKIEVTDMKKELKCLSTIVFVNTITISVLATAILISILK